MLKIKFLFLCWATRREIYQKYIRDHTHTCTRTIMHTYTHTPMCICSCAALSACIRVVLLLKTLAAQLRSQAASCCYFHSDTNTGAHRVDEVGASGRELFVCPTVLFSLLSLPLSLSRSRALCAAFASLLSVSHLAFASILIQLT